MKNEEVHDHFQGYFYRNFGSIDPTYNPDTDIIKEKAIYRHTELPISEYLLSFKSSLVAEFMENYTSVEEAIAAKGINNLQNRKGYHADEKELIRTIINEDESVSNYTAWKSVQFKYQHKEVNVNWMAEEDSFKKYPTAHKLIQEYGDDCPIANYSYMAPNSVLHRHTGPENRTGEFIRIHIPLIIPDGDVFFEVNGEEVHWDNVFGFNNQLVHSAHNLTNKGRLIFLIDIRRSRLNLEPGEPFNKDRQLYALSKPFIRKLK